MTSKSWPVELETPGWREWMLFCLTCSSKKKKNFFKASDKEKKHDQALSGLEREETIQTLMSFASLIRRWF